MKSKNSRSLMVNGIGMKFVSKIPNIGFFLKLLKISSTLMEIKYAEIWSKYNKLQNEFGVNVPGVHFNKLPVEMNFEIGSYSYSSSAINTHHTTRKEKIIIGSYVSIGYNLKIITAGQHNSKALSTSQFITKDQYYSRGDVKIGNDVWIGDDVTILGGTTVGDGAIVGTKSLVTHDLEPFGIYGGVPAKLISYRFDKEVIAEIKQLKWWLLPYDQICKVIGRSSTNDIISLLNSLKSNSN